MAFFYKIMKIIAVSAIFQILFLPNVLSEDENSTLVLLHVLFRHGNRTPDKGSVFPKDLYTTELYAPVGYGQLTPKGKHTEYEIGNYIRKNYGYLIPEQYTENVVYAISTDFKRTKMSLSLVLSATFPPLPSDVFEAKLNWQPVPFNIDEGQGVVAPASLYCPNYISQYYSYVLSKEAQNICAKYKNLYDELTQYAGVDVLNPKEIAKIYFTLKSEDDYGLELPEWSKDIYPDILEEASSVDYEFLTANPTLKKLSAGFLLKKILDDSIAKRDGKLSEERKLFLYSSHEFNVGVMLRTLNVWYRHVPPFGATIFFEIHNVDGEYGLRLLYQDYKQAEPRLLTIPGCSCICSLDDLHQLMQDFLPGENDVCVPRGELV